MSDLNKIREEKIQNFNPDENGLFHKGIFGLPFEPEEAQIVLLPIPWEATVSYSSGTADGPEAILNASGQIDLYDPLYPGGWRAGFAMMPIDEEIKTKSNAARSAAEQYIAQLGTSETPDSNLLDQVNKATEEIKSTIESKSSTLLNQAKLVGLVGGDHSVSLGLMHALAARFENFGVLQFDAHADLRPAYEGFIHSHASIMYNALKIPQISKLVQVGVRDFSEGENALANSEDRICMFTDFNLKNALMSGVSWNLLWNKIVEELPKYVYISFDIDVLQAWLCPHTGTPVPGGFDLEEVFFIIRKLVDSGKQIIGFDLVEVAPGQDEWDANVGARALYKLCLMMAKSNKLKN